MTGSRSRFVRKAFIVGLFVYAVLRLAMHVLMSQAEPLSFASGYWFQILTPVITGYAAGFAAKHDGLSHGAIIGASIPIIESIGFSIATLNISICASIAWHAWCHVGGIVSFFRRIRRVHLGLSIKVRPQSPLTSQGCGRANARRSLRR